MNTTFGTPGLLRSKHLNADGTLNEDGKSLVIAKMRARVREQLRDVRLAPGDKLEVSYIWEVLEDE